MKTFSTVAAFAALAQSALAQGNLPIINTPAAVVQCQPALLTFSGGTAPYFLSVLPGGQTAATPLESLPEQTGNSYTWTVNIASGTSISLQIRDSTGAVNYASEITVQAGTDASCLGTTASAASTTAAAVAATGAASTTARVSSAASAASTTLTTSAATATVTAGSGSPAANVTTSNGTSVDTDSYNFTCTQGLLSYAITTATLNTTLTQATTFFSNWTGAAPGTLINSTGTGVGATRAYTNEGATLQEVLTLQQTNATSGSLHQQWNTTAPITIGNVTIYSAFQDLTIYRNATTNDTSAQWFVLACPSDQTTGIPLLSGALDAGIAYFQQAITGNATASTATPATTTAVPAKLRARWV